MICSKRTCLFWFFYLCIEGSPLWIDFGKICQRENSWNFQKKFQKWPVQDGFDITRNKLIKNQPVWGTHRWAANDKPPRHFCALHAKERKLFFWGNFHLDIENNLALMSFIWINNLIKFILHSHMSHWCEGMDTSLLFGRPGFNSLLGRFFALFIFLNFLPIFTIFRDFQPPEKGLLYQAIPMGPCAFNLNDRALLPKLMAHSHFCALPRNFNF